MGTFKRFAVGAIAVVAMAALVQPADATTFRWTQEGGFFLGPGGGSPTLQGGEVGNGFPAAVRAGQGGLEFFDPATGPINTFRVVGWGCTPDGNNSPGIALAATTCANAGVAIAADSTAVNDPLASTLGARSALELLVFTSDTNLVLDSELGALRTVAIARINHFNRVIDNEANTLLSVSADAFLSILEDNVGEAVITTDLNRVPIGFRETLNVTTGVGNCAQPNPLGSTCDDLFTFDTSQFANVPFTFNGEDFFLQFGLAPVPECDTPAGNVGNIQIFQCDDNINHKIALDFLGGRAWASEGFDNAFLVTMFVTEERINVPAPGGLALLGLGLTGLGLVGAWRKRKSAV